MIDREVLKNVIDKLPTIGDVVKEITNEKIIYESGREISINGNIRLLKGDRVKSLHLDFDHNKSELFIGLVHITSSGPNWVDKTLYNELINLQRRLKIKKIMSKI